MSGGVKTPPYEPIERFISTKDMVIRGRCGPGMPGPYE